eukprot:GFKZ01003715.1.p1 GENE.GFKZ01003715.1~~GFKZ01003715.1.p1  ORF type:complete len:459 (+),score=43.02 GFKZ01003715.1:197-1573(+)
MTSTQPRPSLAPAFIQSASLSLRTATHPAPVALHPLSKGQFAQPLRPTRFNHPCTPSFNPPTQPPSTKRLSQTPTASLFGSLTSVASTGVGVLLLGFIIFIHESGHFLAARLQGIRVKNFSIGFGPRLFNFTPASSETEFTVRLLPLGGYVAFPEHSTLNEQTGEYDLSDDPNLLQNRPLLDRAIVISAGVFANIILAWGCIFASVSTVGLPSYAFHPGVTIANVVDPAGAGAKAGILPGDIILSVNGQEIPQSLDSASLTAETIRTSQGKPLDFHLLRGEKEFDLRVRPKCCTPDGSSAMGVQLVPNASITRVRPSSANETLQKTNMEFARLTRQTWKGVTSIVSNFQRSSQNLSGPIGVVSMGADLARNDTAALLTFCAVISINLAVINSLPLPALDGGQMTFLIIEALRGAPVSLKVQDAINRTALLLFLAFSGVLFFGDLEKLNIVGAMTKFFG